MGRDYEQLDSKLTILFVMLIFYYFIRPFSIQYL